MNETTEPKKIQLAPDQMLAYLYYDLAIHQLTGMASQLNLVHQESTARVFTRKAEELAEKRDSFLRRAESGLVVVPGSALPRPPGAA